MKLLLGAVKELQGGSRSRLHLGVIEPGPQFNSKAFDVLTCEHVSSLISFSRVQRISNTGENGHDLSTKQQCCSVFALQSVVLII